MPDPRICFAILSHNNRPLLEDLIANVRAAAPDEEIVVYNSGVEHDLSGLDVPICPTSSPLGYGKLTRFHAEVMTWLSGQGRTPKYMVTLEPDMMVVRRGFADFLDHTMRDAAYMGTRFHRVPPGWWVNPIGRRARWKWSAGWADLTGTPEPCHSFGPGQIFGREYIEKLVALPQLDEIIERSEVTRLDIIEEIVYPSLAAGMGCRPMSNPGSRAITLKWYPPALVADFLADESVFLMHRVSTDLGAADRRMIRDGLAGRLGPLSSYDARHVPSDPWSQVKLYSERFYRRRKLDITTALRSEVPQWYARRPKEDARSW